MADKPDAVVREPEARASVEELTKGLAEDARRAGLLPPMRAIEDVAKAVTAETIARHEDQFRHGVPDAPKTPRRGSTARLDQGSFSDEIGDAVKIERAFDPARHAAKVGLVSASEMFEAQRALMRLAVLLAIRPGANGQSEWVYPEWAERIHKAHNETLALTKNLGLDPGFKPGCAGNVAADAVLEILDQSVAAFGEWRLAPKAEPAKPLIFT